MNAPELVEALLAYARETADGGTPTLPAELASRSFSWTGEASARSRPSPTLRRARAPRSAPRGVSVLGGK